MLAREPQTPQTLPTLPTTPPPNTRPAPQPQDSSYAAVGSVLAAAAALLPERLLHLGGDEVGGGRECGGGGVCVCVWVGGGVFGGVFGGG